MAETKSKKKNKKKSGPNLYSPEYLVKKHGIKIDETLVINQKKSNNYLSFRYWLFNNPTDFNKLYWAIR